MGKAKSLEFPEPPKYNKPELGIANNTLLSDYGKKLSSGDFTGNLSWLSPTINNNNSANALSYAQGILQPQFRDSLQQITNSAAANGQLNSSTFTDALARSQSDLNSQYQSIVSQQAINDSNQSNANRIGLFGTGLETLQRSIGNDAGFAGAENQFNLANYDNLVAQAIQNNQNANRANGWQQVLGFSPIGHDYLQSQGITNVPGYGVADAAKIASLFVPGNGGFQGGGLSSQSPQNLGTASRSGFNVGGAGSYASNNPFGDINTKQSYQNIWN